MDDEDRAIRLTHDFPVERRGAVRRAKLYYLRGLTGKKARIREKRDDRRPAKQKGS